MVVNLPTMQETRVRFLGWEDPLEEGMVSPLQYSGLENPMRDSLLPQKSLSDYSPWGHEELDTT